VKYKAFFAVIPYFFRLFTCVLLVKRVWKNKGKIIGEKTNEKNLDVFVVDSDMLLGRFAFFRRGKQGNRQF
jgi:hypothetical protein